MVTVIVSDINTGKVIRRYNVGVRMMNMTHQVKARGYTPQVIRLNPDDRVVEVNLVPRFGAL